eukprot:gene31427-38814_t
MLSQVATVAGTGVASYSGDGGAASSATLNNPVSVWNTPTGKMFISDSFNFRVRTVNGFTGIVSHFAGNGVGTGSGAGSSTGDGGAATSATIFHPIGISVDTSSNVYIPEQDGYRIRKVDATSRIISTYAGTGSGTYSGDGGPAT